MPQSITSLRLIKQYANIPLTVDTYDEVLDQLAVAAQELIQDIYGLSFSPQTYYNEEYNEVWSSGANGEALLNLRHVPIVSILQIASYTTEDTSDQDAAILIPQTNFRIRDAEAGIIGFTTPVPFNPTGLQEVTIELPQMWHKLLVTYQAGLTQVPFGVRLGAAMLISHWFGRVGHDMNLQTLNFGGVANTFFDTTQWPDGVKEILTRYDKRSRVGIV